MHVEIAHADRILSDDANSRSLSVLLAEQNIGQAVERSDFRVGRSHQERCVACGFIDGVEPKRNISGRRDRIAHVAVTDVTYHTHDLQLTMAVCSLQLSNGVLTLEIL